MTIRRWQGLAGIAMIAVTSAVTGGLVLQPDARAADRNGARFNEVLRLVSRSYVDNVEDARLYEQAIHGLLASLDRHSRFLTPEDYATFRFDALGEYAGIGAEVGVRGNWPTVIAPLPDSPAERAGLRIGDRIVEIDGVSTEGWSQLQVVQQLRGRQGTAITLGIGRTGLEVPIRIELIRKEIQVPAVRSAFLMEDGVGYVELGGFGAQTAVKMRAALDRLVAEGARSLLIDLRRNPGGVMAEGIAVADLFLDRGVPIAELRGRAPRSSERFVARAPDRYSDIPVVVLVGPSSASASEILAGAIQDNDRGLVLGEASYGKGLVQTIYLLKDDHRLVLTTGRWYSPSGRSIQRPTGHDAERQEAAPEFRSVGGRLLGSVGGIEPDVTVHPDTLQGDDRAFAMRMTGQDLQRYLATRLEFAVRHLASNPDLRTDFEITPDMLDRFYHDLADGGVELDRDAYDAAVDLVAFGIAEDIAYSRWGETERRRRQNLRDSQVLAAHGLLAQTD